MPNSFHLSEVLDVWKEREIGAMARRRVLRLVAVGGASLAVGAAASGVAAKGHQGNQTGKHNDDDNGRGRDNDSNEGRHHGEDKNHKDTPPPPPPAPGPGMLPA